MKTHLLHPDRLGVMQLPENHTLCGINLTGFTTRDPLEVNCKRCRMAYEGNVAWYWWHMGLDEAPAGQKYSDKDTPLGGMYLVELIRGGVKEVRILRTIEEDMRR